MCLKKIDVKVLIKKAKDSLRKDDPSYEMLNEYINATEKMLPEIKGELNSKQKEIYKNLEVAVGP